MNILFFSRLFYPHIGGVEKHVLEISRLLIKKGHNVTVVTEQDSQKTIPTEIFEGIKIFRITNLENKKFKKFQIWIWLFLNIKLIKNADVVHCHDVFFWYLPFRFIFPFKKIFTTFHGYEGFPLRPKDILMHKISEKLSMGNICIGGFIKKWYGTKPNFVSYGAAKVNNFNLSVSNKVSQNSAVFIGRLDDQTGILTYVEAVKLIKKNIPNFKFEIIGDGKFGNEIKKSFKVFGFKENPEKYLNNYNFAFASGYLSMLEAIMAKRLVIALYDNPLKEDYLRMTPFSEHIIIANSASEIADKIYHFILNPKEKDELIADAYKWGKKQTWNEMTNMYIELWKIKS